MRVLLLLAFALAQTAPPTARAADVSLVVPDAVTAVASVTESVERAGGYVTASRVWRDGTRTRATLVIRIPSRQLMTTLAAVRRVGRVEGETVALRACVKSRP